MVIIVIWILIIIMPSFSSFSYNEEAPIWAIGNISGKWGIREYDLLVDILDGDKGNGMV